ncbi:MAG: hypothetical protein NTU63_02030 [Candidatus Pacearchaeota archaeon]|nr:hypothetical protein [Candidatus Pacearchaeota archaeon]
MVNRKLKDKYENEVTERFYIYCPMIFKDTDARLIYVIPQEDRSIIMENDYGRLHLNKPKSFSFARKLIPLDNPGGVIRFALSKLEK